MAKDSGPRPPATSASGTFSPIGAGATATRWWHGHPRGTDLRLITEARLDDGTPAQIWPMLPGDREMLRESYERLSPESRRSRFLGAVPHLTDAMLDHLVDEVDGIDHVALVLEVVDADHVGLPVGLARMIRYEQEPTVADVAVTVLDAWQHRGVATALLAELVRERPRGVTRIATTVAADNAPSLAMLARLGPLVASTAGNGRVDVRVDLVPVPQDP